MPKKFINSLSIIPIKILIRVIISAYDKNFLNSIENTHL